MSLRDDIIARIAAQGPMRIDEYMTTCLLHPTKGYYTTRDPLGAKGDFVTAPEISQMFGELVGLALAQSWLSHGAPAPFTLAELGPGRGTLMADALRATRAVPGFVDAARIVLVEASPALRQRQAETLEGYEVAWVPDADALPDQPLYLVANEFFDALPIRQFVREGNRWRERQVGLSDGALAFGLAPPQPQPALAARLEDVPDGALIETASAAVPVMDAISRRIAAHGGAALIVDYGGWHLAGSSLQAVRRHEKVDVLAHPGEADLTAHVDFALLAEMAQGCRVSPMTPQGVFLERLGITQRAQALAAGLSGSPLETHVAAHRRLTHPQEMGNLFKVMALTQEGSALPPGLQP